MIGVLIAYHTFLREKRFIQGVLCSVVTGLVTVVAYFPSYLYSGRTFAFLDFAIGDWPVIGYVARFVVRNVYFWGVPGAALIALSILPIVRERFRVRNPWRGNVVVTALLAIAAMEAVYLRVPLDMAYLLPILPFTLILLGLGLANRRTFLIMIVAAILSYHFVDIKLIQPDNPNNASGATLTFCVQRGYTLCFLAERDRQRVVAASH
jgi:hypothetical protein